MIGEGGERGIQTLKKEGDGMDGVDQYIHHEE